MGANSYFPIFAMVMADFVLANLKTNALWPLKSVLKMFSCVCWNVVSVATGAQRWGGTDVTVASGGGSDAVSTVVARVDSTKSTLTDTDTSTHVGTVTVRAGKGWHAYNSLDIIFVVISNFKLYYFREETRLDYPFGKSPMTRIAIRCLPHDDASIAMR